MSILKEIILASTHQMDFRHNEVAQEVLTQLQSFQAQMPALIEQALMSDPDVRYTSNVLLLCPAHSEVVLMFLFVIATGSGELVRSE